MRIFRNIDEIDIKQSTALTVGTFDGVHLGHRKVIERLKASAVRCKCPDVLITFHPHPKQIVETKNGSEVRLLTSLEEKLDILNGFNLDAVLVIPFTKEFSRTNYQEFVKDILVSRLKVERMVIGHDHAFGRNREGHPEQLKAISKDLGFYVEIVPPFHVDHDTVSSSLIRKKLLQGQIERANELLGRKYMVLGKVVEGSNRGKEIGFPTANMETGEPHKLIPAEGVYAVDVIVDQQRYKGMMNIGHRPTFNYDPLTLEVHIINFAGYIYGKTVKLEFKKFIRGERKFQSPSELKEQLIQDKNICLNI
jgi:riboflavin kinase/FMN adenylyltransferase